MSEPAAAGDGGPIVAIGGAELTLRAENEALHEWLLSLVDSPRPRICLLPTAAGDPREAIGSFFSVLGRHACEPSSISLFRLAEADLDLERQLLSQDIIYVAGGNMVNLMALWREHDLPAVLREAHARGTLLCGYSAGSMCWFEHGVSRGVGRPTVAAGLGLLAGSHCVHYSQDPPRRRAYRELVATGAIPPGLGLDDHAAALFRGGRLVETVASHRGARSYEVAPGAEGARERALPIRLLERPREPEETALEEMRALRRLRAASPAPARRL